MFRPMSRRSGVRLLFAGSCALLALLGPSLSAHGAPRSAYITVVHGLPKFTADIYVNGKLTLDGFKPESETDALALPPGRYHLAIRNVGDPATADPVLKGTVTLKAGRSYTAVAHLDGTSAPELSLFQNDVTRVPAGSTRLVVRNVSDSPEVAVALDGKQRFSGLAPMDERDAIVRAGKASISVSTTDGGSVGPTPIHLTEGTAQIVYVIGSASAGTLDLMLQSIDRLSSGPANVLSGTGGNAAPSGLPGWSLAILALASATALVVVVDTIRRPRRSTG